MNKLVAFSPGWLRAHLQEGSSSALKVSQGQRFVSHDLHWHLAPQHTMLEAQCPLLGSWQAEACSTASITNHTRILQLPGKAQPHKTCSLTCTDKTDEVAGKTRLTHENHRSIKGLQCYEPNAVASLQNIPVTYEQQVRLMHSLGYLAV